MSRRLNFVAYTLDWPQLHASMHLAQASDCNLVQVSLRLKLPVLSYILLKRKFVRHKQVDSVKEHLTRTQTDSWVTRCHCLFVAWLHLKCYCDSDSTKVATIQQPRRWPKRSSPLQDPRKRLWIFFLLNQPLPAVWALETWWKHSAMSAGAG